MSNTNKSRSHRQPNSHRPPRNPPPPDHPQDLPHGENKKWTRGEVMTAIAIIISILMTYVTYRLFDQTLNQTKSATESAKAAKISADAASRSANLQKQALDSQIAAKKQSDISDSRKEKRDIEDMQQRFIRDTTQAGIQRRAFQVQTKALQETQKEFDIENRPFFQVINISVDTSQKDMIRTTYYITNTGKQPGRIISAKYYDGVETEPTPYDDFILLHDTKLEGSYIANGVSKEMHDVSGDDIKSVEKTNGVKRGNGYIQIMGDITYQSTIGNNIHETIYYFRIRLKPFYDVNTVREEYK